MSLWNDAACVGVSADLFTAAAEAGGRHTVTAAKAVCGRCPARPACLSWAISADEPGVWAGLDQQERRRIRRGPRAYPRQPRAPL